MKAKAKFPLLAEFARGYLHQDLVPEYGDALGAGKAYVADLSETERKALVAESHKMLALSREWTIDEVNQELHRLGAASSFDSVDEFLELLHWFERQP